MKNTTDNPALTFLWQGFAVAASDTLRTRGYAPATAQLYAAITQRMGCQLRMAPTELTRARLRDAIGHHAGNHAAASTASLICALRATLDGVAGLGLTSGIPTPKRRYPLPWCPSREQTRRILASGATLRDQLLLGLLYGTGCRPGELVRLRWADVDIERRLIRLPGDRQLTPRQVPLPCALLPLLTQGTHICHAAALIFPGRSPTRPLTVRTVETIVRRTVRPLHLLNEVSASSLRHAFAIHALADGWNVRQLQTALGHRTLRPVLRYQRCTPPDIPSPADAIFDADALPIIQTAAFSLPFSPDRTTETPRRLFMRALRAGLRGLFAFRPPG